MSLPPFLANQFIGFSVSQLHEFPQENRIEIHLAHLESAQSRCSRCHSPFSDAPRAKHRRKLETLPILGARCFVLLWIRKFHCAQCKKWRSEHLEFEAHETPHLTREYAWWIGKMAEFASVSRVAEFLGLDPMQVWRLDHRRMQAMLEQYKIPEFTKISVDEVYARRKPKFEGESRDERFFTVITDLTTRKVIWVTFSRKGAALEEFFGLLSQEQRSAITVVAIDQHEGYLSAVHKHCPNASIVWDRFHIMQKFEEAVNEERKSLHEEAFRGSELQRLTRGQFRFLFLKKASRRTEQEAAHIDWVLKKNERFAKLELIKERMISLFHEPGEAAAKAVFDEIGSWIIQAGFRGLKAWHDRLEASWETFKNYFEHRVTTSVSEGINNVIKALKRQAFGYRNMHYFRLKIMQRCGYLNSRFISLNYQHLQQK